jgi:hypothetical protein
MANFQTNNYIVIDLDYTEKNIIWALIKKVVNKMNNSHFQSTLKK